MNVTAACLPSVHPWNQGRAHITWLGRMRGAGLLGFQLGLFKKRWINKRQTAARIFYKESLRRWLRILAYTESSTKTSTFADK